MWIMVCSCKAWSRQCRPRRRLRWYYRLSCRLRLRLQLSSSGAWPWWSVHHGEAFVAQLSIRSTVLDEVIEQQKANPRLQEMVGKVDGNMKPNLNDRDLLRLGDTLGGEEASATLEDRLHKQEDWIWVGDLHLLGLAEEGFFDKLNPLEILFQASETGVPILEEDIVRSDSEQEE
ncbi:hypothetical protein Taro_050663 [Colocasia esculenta]|uniref:Uncharacterized protein n=1 Tax=Colocasia esculenta TaxID=4460 RepID=A0A843XEV1_COLES|nr:hypothetical protein [Colocasia esculenta]